MQVSVSKYKLIGHKLNLNKQILTDLSSLLFSGAATGTFRGSLTGISIGTVTETQKIWRSFQALGDIAFAYSYSVILIEIQVPSLFSH